MKKTVPSLFFSIAVGLAACFALLLAWPVALFGAAAVLYAGAVVLWRMYRAPAALIPIAALAALAGLAFGPLPALAVAAAVALPVAAGAYAVTRPGVSLERASLMLALVCAFAFVLAYLLVWRDAGQDPMTALFHWFGGTKDPVIDSSRRMMVQFFSAMGLIPDTQSITPAEQTERMLALLQIAYRQTIVMQLPVTALGSGGMMAFFGAVAQRRLRRDTLTLPDLSLWRLPKRVWLGVGLVTLVLFFMAQGNPDAYSAAAQALWNVLAWLLAVQGLSCSEFMFRRRRMSPGRRYAIELAVFFLLPTAATLMGGMDVLLDVRRLTRKPDKKEEE